jgi:hemoglobin-like flavoprotein
MTQADIIAFHDSFERCMWRPDFFDIFYDHFLKSSPQVALKFQGTNFDRQKRLLKLSLHMMMGALVWHSANYSMLTPVAKRHSRKEKDIPPHLYTLWMDSLIFAVKTCDPYFKPQVEKNWRTAMQPGIDYIISFY